jgi:hypothetical protein
MKIKTVKRYYCDFCKKQGGSSFYMRRHELHCTNNPKRACRLCALGNGGNGCDIAEAVKILGTGHDAKFKAMREFVDGCPACMLAVIRQSLLIDIEINESYALLSNFDFRAESKKYLNDCNPTEYY